MQTATGNWNVTGTKSDPFHDRSRASSCALATACSWLRASPGYLTEAKSWPSGTLSVSSTRKPSSVAGSAVRGVVCTAEFMAQSCPVVHWDTVHLGRDGGPASTRLGSAFAAPRKNRGEFAG